MLSVTTQSGALWLLSALAACILTSTGPTSRGNALLAALLFAAVLATAGGFLLQWVPSAAEVATVVGCACAWQLLRPGSARFPLLAASLCAALASVVQMQQGAPVFASTVLVVGPAGLALWFASHAGFAPSRMREQALTGLVLAAPVIGALPGVMSGWQSAVTINLAANVRPVERFPDWVWQFVVAMLALGVLRQLWVRR